MPGVEQTSVDELLRDAARPPTLGVGGVMLFGIPDTKDATGSEAWNDDAPVQQAVRALKRDVPELVVITDVCLCEYTDHGHCGVIRDGERVDNDATLELLAREAVSHARAGADIVAPSDMMDGRVAAIRAALDAHGFRDTAILSYAAKFAGPFYGPFREAAESTPQFGDRRSYQMDSANARRSAARSRARHRGGRRHGDGEAGRSVPRHHPSREGRDRLSGGRVPGERRVRDDSGGRRARLDRSASAR